MITIDLSIYGLLARVAGGKYIAQVELRLKDNATVSDIFEHYNISPEEKSYVFINAILCDVPGLNASAEERLKEHDHVGIFSDGYMWPYQYRNGAPISKRLERAMKEIDMLHHTYTNGQE